MWRLAIRLWVPAQAFLFLKERFGGDLDKLRRIGIRTIFDFRTVCEVAEQRAQIAAETGVSKLKIDLIYQQTKDDNEVARLVEFQNRLSSLGDKQDA